MDHFKHIPRWVKSALVTLDQNICQPPHPAKRQNYSLFPYLDHYNVVQFPQHDCPRYLFPFLPRSICSTVVGSPQHLGIHRPRLRYILRHRHPSLHHLQLFPFSKEQRRDHWHRTRSEREDFRPIQAEQLQVYASELR
jgi:hypothetical protein